MSGAVLVSGASGLLGRALAARRAIVPLSRRDPPPDGTLRWVPETGEVELGGRSVAALVHLAGESVAAGRWTEPRKRALVESRVDTTRALIDWIAKLEPRPATLVVANAVGYYGDRGDETLDEASPPGKGFLADLCVRWQSEAERAEALGVRTVILRIAPVLSAEGGMLGGLLPLFRLGLGGRLGSGEQWFPWIHVGDMVAIFERALDDSTLRGAYNAVAPQCVRQAEFAHTLGRVLRRPTRLPTPAFALRLALGELADEALLASARVVPERLLAQGHRFRFRELEPALRDLLTS